MRTTIVRQWSDREITQAEALLTLLQAAPSGRYVPRGVLIQSVLGRKPSGGGDYTRGQEKLYDLMPLVVSLCSEGSNQIPNMVPVPGHRKGYRLEDTTTPGGRAVVMRHALGELRKVATITTRAWQEVDVVCKGNPGRSRTAATARRLRRDIDQIRNMVTSDAMEDLDEQVKETLYVP